MSLNALVRRAVLALALIVIVLLANTQNNMANIITDLMGGIANLWTKKPTNIKEYIISKDDLKNVDLLDEFTQQTKMIESSGGTNTVNKISSAMGDFQFLTRDHLTDDGEQRFNEKTGDPLISSYQVGLNRLATIYADMGEVPQWVSQAKENDNPLDLTDKQQEELFLANLWKQKGTSDLFKRIDEGDALAKYDLYTEYHHTNPGQATIDLALSEFNLGDKE